MLRHIVRLSTSTCSSGSRVEISQTFRSESLSRENAMCTSIKYILTLIVLRSECVLPQCAAARVCDASDDMEIKDSVDEFGQTATSSNTRSIIQPHLEQPGR